MCVGIDDVHGAAAAAAEPGVLAGELGHQPTRIRAAREKMPVRAMRAVEVVAAGERGGDTDRDAFLADPDMDEPFELLAMAQLDHALLEAADQQHALQHVPVEGVGFVGHLASFP